MDVPATQLQHQTPIPIKFDLQYLKDITNQFSEELILGSGGFGTVYKGVEENGRVLAVKKINDMQGVDNNKFLDEVKLVMDISHPNIVRAEGYCYQIVAQFMSFNGSYVVAEEVSRLLCFEYLPRGSLNKYLSESSKLDWHVRYNIIKGICNGLHCLHEGKQGAPILHLDLKPHNVLLDEQMTPKIGDFGQSRLFGEDVTHNSTVHMMGTRGYMAPEYLLKGRIMKESDIYSLGVILMEIVTGDKKYPTTEELSEVKDMWRRKLKATLTKTALEKQCGQIDLCTIIAQRCIKKDPRKRPNIKQIIEILGRLDGSDVEEESWEVVPLEWREALAIVALSSPEQSGEGMVILSELLRKSGTESTVPQYIIKDADKLVSDLSTMATRIGLWGAGGGAIRDVDVEPRYLNSITIRSDSEHGVIISLAFSYIDGDGKPRHGGTWGSDGRRLTGTINTIQLGPSEYLKQISGTFGVCHEISCEVLTSLTFISNESTYGPFGREEGNPFSSPVLTNKSIVGFFVRSGAYVEAIGAYVQHGRETMILQEVSIKKIGPWGGHGGTLNDMEVLPQRLLSVVLTSSGHTINSIAFTYIDCDGQQGTAGPWGGYGPIPRISHTVRIVLGPSEFLKQVSGTIDSHNCVDVVTTIRFVTDVKTYGPFGKGEGIPFHTPALAEGTSIIGFFANTGWHLDTLGVYVGGYIDSCLKTTRIGPWGARGGPFRDVDVEPRYLNSITIRTDSKHGVIISLAFSYIDGDGKPRHGGTWGSKGCRITGTINTIQLGPSEYLKQISGTFGVCHEISCEVLTSLTFISNERTYGPFGREKGNSFRSPVLSNKSIVGFFVRSEAYVEAIGVYIQHGMETMILPQEVSIKKIGPWGGHGGGLNDIEVLPQRLLSVVLTTSEKTINSIAFTYIDCDGQQRTAGPWGGYAPFPQISHTIALGPSEFLKQVSGTIDRHHGIDVVMTIRFVTNGKSYGPFGQGEGIPFHTPALDEGTSIIGFFANAWWHLDALGIYVG